MDLPEDTITDITGIIFLFYELFLLFSPRSALIDQTYDQWSSRCDHPVIVFNLMEGLLGKSGLWSYKEKNGVEGESGSVRSDIPSLVVIWSPELLMLVSACSPVLVHQRLFIRTGEIFVDEVLVC